MLKRFPDLMAKALDFPPDFTTLIFYPHFSNPNFGTLISEMWIDFKIIAKALDFPLDSTTLSFYPDFSKPDFSTLISEMWTDFQIMVKALDGQRTSGNGSNLQIPWFKTSIKDGGHFRYVVPLIISVRLSNFKDGGS